MKFSSEKHLSYKWDEEQSLLAILFQLTPT